MRKHAVVVTLATLELLAIALMAFFWFVMRADLIATYGLDGSGAPLVPPLTRVALSVWFVPALGSTGALLVAVAFLPRWRPRARTELASAGLVWTVLGLALAMWAAYAPVFERLGAAPVETPLALSDLRWR